MANMTVKHGNLAAISRFCGMPAQSYLSELRAEGKEPAGFVAVKEPAGCDLVPFGARGFNYWQAEQLVTEARERGRATSVMVCML